MAKPQTENGFVMLACDLFAALGLADWPKREWTILIEVLSQLYGPMKLRSVHLDFPTIEHYSGLDSCNARRAAKNLVDCKVLKLNPNGSYAFEKDWETWDYVIIEKLTKSKARTPRLGDGEKRYASSVNGRFGVEFASTKQHKRQSNGTAGQSNGTVGDERGQSNGTVGDERGQSNGTVGDEGINGKIVAETSCDETSSVLPVAGACAPASEELRTEIRRTEKGLLSTEAQEGAGVGPSETEVELDKLRDHVANLTKDPGLAAVFRDQVMDWMNGGMIVSDVRQAIMVAHEKNVGGSGYSNFVASAARRVRGDRLREERIEAEAAKNPVSIPLPSRPQHSGELPSVRRQREERESVWTDPSSQDFLAAIERSQSNAR